MGTTRWPALPGALALLLTGATTGARAGQADLEQRWRRLGSADAGEAQRAVLALAAVPGQAVPFLRERLRPATAAKLDPQRVRGLLADLDSPKYAVRQRASAAVQDLGQAVLPALRAHLAASPSLEVRRRLERLIAVIEQSRLTPSEIQAVRAVQVLERIGTPAARRVLRALARGAPQAPLTEEAKEALERLAQ
jgi:hypothetical protein